MNDVEDLLSQLREIHLPDAVSFWPPAIGWWLLMLVVVVLALSAYWGLKYYFHPNVRKDAMIELEKLNQRLKQDGALAQYYINVSILIRRIAITLFGRKQVAGLAGENWLAFLDKTSATTFFTVGNGRLLITAPYMRSAEDLDENVSSIRRDEEIEQFTTTVKNWVVKNT